MIVYLAIFPKIVGTGAGKEVVGSCWHKRLSIKRSSAWWLVKEVSSSNRFWEDGSNFFVALRVFTWISSGFRSKTWRLRWTPRHLLALCNVVHIQVSLRGRRPVASSNPWSVSFADMSCLELKSRRSDDLSPLWPTEDACNAESWRTTSTVLHWKWI